MHGTKDEGGLKSADASNKERAARLKRKLVAVKTERERLERELKRSELQREQAEEKLRANSTRVETLQENLNDGGEQARDHLARVRKEAKQQLFASRNEIRILRPIPRIHAFVRACLDAREQLSADAYVAHDVLPLQAVHALASITGGLRMCDAIEIPSFTGRVLPASWEPEVVATIDAAAEGFLGRCDRLLTIGPSLAERLQGFDRPVHVIENFRYRETVTPNTVLRERCGLGDGDRIVLSVGHVVAGFEIFIEALALLPPQFHLVTLGTFPRHGYRELLEKRVAIMGLGSRVHFLEPVPYGELTSTAAGADCGIIVRDVSIPNNRVSLPNRVFDLTASGLPIVSTDVPDIAAFLAANAHGRVIAEHSAEELARAVLDVVKEGAALRSKALEAADRCCWEQQESRIMDAFDGAGSVTFLGLGRLRFNNRTRRMALTLARNGIKVVVADPHVALHVEPENPNIRMVKIEIAS